MNGVRHGSMVTRSRQRTAQLAHAISAVRRCAIMGRARANASRTSKEQIVTDARRIIGASRAVPAVIRAIVASPHRPPNATAKPANALVDLERLDYDASIVSMDSGTMESMDVRSATARLICRWERFAMYVPVNVIVRKEPQGPDVINVCSLI